MKSLIHLLPLVSVFLLVTACGPTQVATSSNPMHERSVLYDNTWDLVELNGTTIVPGDRYSYLTFSPNSNTILGYTGCNEVGGTIALRDADGITFSPVVTTKNTCANHSVDAALVPALKGVDRWAVADDDLYMYKNGVAVARWTPSSFSNDDLYGNWQLSYVSDSDIPFDVLYPTDKRPTLTFAVDKDHVSGTTGYNTINCPVTLNAGGFTFSDCTNSGTMTGGQGETMFMKNLNAIHHYSITDDDQLVVITDDNRVMRFSRLK